MEPAGKRPKKNKPSAASTVRKLRFDSPHAQVPKPPHYLRGKERPDDR